VTLLVIGLFISADKIKEYYIKSKLEPQLELQVAVNNMSEATSYRYKLASSFTVDGRKEVISQVEGEKNQDNTHIKGEMVNTPVNIYYVDSTVYNYDSSAQKWLVIDGDTSNVEDLLISELNPLSNFRFKKVDKVEKLGFEEINSMDCLVVMCDPSIDSQLLETLWKDFEYKLWIDFHKKLIKKAVLNATNKKIDTTKLTIEVDFSDINKKIKIEPPDTSK